MMILPLLLIMILPKMMNDPETRKVYNRSGVFVRLTNMHGFWCKELVPFCSVLSVQGDCHRLLS